LSKEKVILINVSLWPISTKLQVSEQTYWQQIKTGDKKAYETIFRTWYQVLCNYACSLIKDMDEAEEVVQNVFYTIWKKREELEIGSIKAYLYRAVHNDCLNKIKHAKIKMNYAQDYKHTAQAGLDSSTQLLNAKELSVKIHEAIDSLPEQCGLVFRLNRFENKKYSEIASELGISVKTVENHMGKALKIMRERLKDYLPVIGWWLFCASAEVLT
jgi:RNA polymerase sigma-70 factor (ECF subfamily)